MYYLVTCRCGIIYGEPPEKYSPANPHPRNFCPECARKIEAWECDIAPVPYDVWRNFSKHYFQPNYVDC